LQANQCNQVKFLVVLRRYFGQLLMCRKIWRAFCLV